MTSYPASLPNSDSEPSEGEGVGASPLRGRILVALLIGLVAVCCFSLYRYAQYKTAFSELDAKYRILSNRYQLVAKFYPAVYGEDPSLLRESLTNLDWDEAPKAEREFIVGGVLNFFQNNRGMGGDGNPGIAPGLPAPDGARIFGDEEGLYSMVSDWMGSRFRAGVPISTQAVNDAISFLGHENAVRPESFETVLKLCQDAESLRTTHPEVDLAFGEIEKERLLAILSDPQSSRNFLVLQLVSGRCDFLTSLREYIIANPADFPPGIEARIITYEYSCYRRHRTEEELLALQPVFAELGHDPSSVYEELLP